MFVFILLAGLIIVVVFFAKQQVKYSQMTEPIREKERQKYLKSIQRDIKKYLIPEKYLTTFKAQAEAEQGCYYFGWAIVCGFVIAAILEFIFLCIMVDTLDLNDRETDDPLNIMVIMPFFILWIWIGHCIGVKMSTNKESITTQVKESYEQFRCPHCGCPLVYRQVDEYQTDEKHYLKRVKREEYIGNKRYTYTDDVPMTSFVQHDIYECAICNTRDDNARTIEHETN